MHFRKVSFKTVAFSSPEKLKKTKRDIFFLTPFRDYVDGGLYACAASLVDNIFFKNDDSHELILFDHKSKEAMQQVAVIAQKLYFLSYLFINCL